MRRLRTQVHLTIVAVLALFAVLAGAAWWHATGLREQGRLADAVAQTAVELLPGPDRPVAELQATLDRRRNRQLATVSRTVVQCSAWEIRHEPWEVMRDLLALGVPRAG